MARLPLMRFIPLLMVNNMKGKPHECQPRAAMKAHWATPEFRASQYAKRGKLTDAQAQAIIDLHEAPPVAGYRRPTYQMIGAQFGVSAVMVFKIVHNKNFKHLRRKPA